MVFLIVHKIFLKKKKKLPLKIFLDDPLAHFTRMTAFILAAAKSTHKSSSENTITGEDKEIKFYDSSPARWPRVCNLGDTFKKHFSHSWFHSSHPLQIRRFFFFNIAPTGDPRESNRKITDRKTNSRQKTITSCPVLQLPAGRRTPHGGGWEMIGVGGWFSRAVCLLLGVAGV